MALPKFISLARWFGRETQCRIKEYFAFSMYRAKQAESGVWIDPGAIIWGSRGINFGPGTRIHESALIAATNMLPSSRFRCRPDGTIRVGRRCAILPSAMLISYDGWIEIGDDVSVNPGA